MGRFPIRASSPAVESVAWVAERKDVLCAFFWFSRYGLRALCRTAGPGTLPGGLALFILGVMSKPMIVTLPFLLLVLDAWPLRRLSRKR